MRWLQLRFGFWPLGTNAWVLSLSMGGIQGFGFVPVVHVSGGRDLNGKFCGIHVCMNLCICARKYVMQRKFKQKLSYKARTVHVINFQDNTNKMGIFRCHMLHNRKNGYYLVNNFVTLSYTPLFALSLSCHILISKTLGITRKILTQGFCMGVFPKHIMKFTSPEAWI